MKVYQIKKKKISKISERPFKLEKDLQILAEENLRTLFNLEFITSEYALNNLRIDTLCYDADSNSFVIIEYKKDRNFSVIDQGYAYLSLLLNNKADFILEYNDKANKMLRKDDIDWSQSRVIFVAPEFTTYQREAINFRDLPIELWEVKRYENDFIVFNEIKATSITESIVKISAKKGTVKDVSKEVKVYSEDTHLSLASNKMKEFYNDYKNVLLSWDEVEIKTKKKTLAFKANSIFVDFILQKNNIKIIINLKKGQLNDPRGITVDMENIGHWGNGDYQIRVNENEEFEYVLTLIKQSYDFHKN